MKNYSKEILLGTALLFLFAGLLFWLLFVGSLAPLVIVIAILIVLVGAFSFIRLVMRRKQMLSTGEPAEDEFTKLATVYAGNQAFMYSLYLWLLIFVLKESFEKNATMLGIGILGSCAIYGVFSWYYKKTGKFDEK